MLDHSLKCVDYVFSGAGAFDVRGCSLLVLEVLDDFADVISFGYVDSYEFGSSSFVPFEFFDELF